MVNGQIHIKLTGGKGNVYCKLKGSSSWEELVWFGSLQSNKICTPNTIEELVMIVKQAKYRNETIRVTGAGHSFTPLVATGEVIISLQRLRGVETVDQSTNTVSVWGG